LHLCLSSFEFGSSLPKSRTLYGFISGNITCSLLERYRIVKKADRDEEKLRIALTFFTFLAIASNFAVGAYAQAEVKPEIEYALIGAGLAIGLAGLGPRIGIGQRGSSHKRFG